MRPLSARTLLLLQLCCLISLSGVREIESRPFYFPRLVSETGVSRPEKYRTQPIMGRHYTPGTVPKTTPPSPSRSKAGAPAGSGAPAAQAQAVPAAVDAKLLAESQARLERAPAPRQAAARAPGRRAPEPDPAAPLVRQLHGEFDCAKAFLEPNGADAGQYGLSVDWSERGFWGVFTTRTEPPLRLACYKRNDIVCEKVEFGGIWDSNLTAALAWAGQAVPPDLRFPGAAGLQQVVLDVGAHVGYFGLLAAAQGHRVHLLEPMMANRALIRQSLCENPHFANRVVLHPYGAGPPSTCKLYSFGHNVGDGRVYCPPGNGAPSPAAPPGGELRGHVLLQPVDRILEAATSAAAGGAEAGAAGEVAGEVAVWFLKIDVEGFEHAALRSAQGLLGAGRVAFLCSEVAPHMMGSHSAVLRYIRFLWGYNFQVYFESFEGPALLSEGDVLRHLSDIYDEYNIYAIRKDLLPLIRPDLRERMYHPPYEVGGVMSRVERAGLVQKLSLDHPEQCCGSLQCLNDQPDDQLWAMSKDVEEKVVWCSDYT